MGGVGGGGGVLTQIIMSLADKPLPWLHNKKKKTYLYLPLCLYLGWVL